MDDDSTDTTSAAGDESQYSDATCQDAGNDDQSSDDSSGETSDTSATDDCDADSTGNDPYNDADAIDANYDDTNPNANGSDPAGDTDNGNTGDDGDGTLASAGFGGADPGLESGAGISQEDAATSNDNDADSQDDQQGNGTDGQGNAGDSYSTLLDSGAGDQGVDSDTSGGDAGYATDSLTGGLGTSAGGLWEAGKSMAWALNDAAVDTMSHGEATVEALGAGFYSGIGQDDIAEKKIASAMNRELLAQKAHDNLLKDVGLKSGEREHLGSNIDPIP